MRARARARADGAAREPRTAAHARLEDGLGVRPARPRARRRSPSKTTAPSDDPTRTTRTLLFPYRQAFSTSGLRMRSIRSASTPTSPSGRGARRVQLQRDVASLGEGCARSPALIRGLARTARPPRASRLRCAAADQRVDHARPSDRPASRIAVRAPRATRSASCGRRSASSASAAHAGERRAQLVRHLGGEALLVAQARGDPREQAVERRGQRVSSSRGAPSSKRRSRSCSLQSAAPLGHLRHRAQGAVERRADRQPAVEQHEQRRRRSTRAGARPARLLVAAPARRRRRRCRRRLRRRRRSGCAYSRTSSVRSTVRAPAGPRLRAPARRRSSGAPRPLDDAAPVEDPDAPVERLVVGRLARADATDPP